MSDLFEFFFCPVHGIFRPDILMGLKIMLDNGLLTVRLYLMKVGII